MTISSNKKFISNQKIGLYIIIIFTILIIQTSLSCYDLNKYKNTKKTNYEICQIDTNLDHNKLTIHNLSHKYLFYLNKNFFIVSIIMLLICFITFAKIKILYPLYDFQRFAYKIGLNLNAKSLKPSSNKIINETVNTLNFMKSKVNTLFNYQTKLLAATVHDIQIPLSKILLRKDHKSQEYNEDKKNIQEVKSLLENLLKYTKDNWITMEPIVQVNLINYITNIVLEYDHPNITLSFVNKVDQVNLYLNIRPRSLSRAIENIISNAFKFAQQAIEIHLNSNNEYIIISIIDDGAGIGQNNTTEIFKPFNSSEKIDAHGIGLTISTEIIKAHQGYITAKNEPHRGLNVSIYLPKK